MVDDRDVLNAALAAFFGVVAATIAIALFWQWIGERRRTAVMSTKLAEVRNATPGSGGIGGLLRGRKEESMEPLVALARRFGWAGTIEAKLMHAGMSWDLGTFMVLTCGAALGPLVFLLMLTGLYMFVLPYTAKSASTR